MKKTIWVFGSISGLIITMMMIYATVECYTNPDMQANDVVGYAAMIAAFAFVFVGIKNYRDKYNGGVITFGKAFKIGALITLVASGMYVVVWLIDYYIFMPDFMDKYIPHVLKEAGRNGASAAELQEKATEMENFKEMYQNPLFVIVITFLEIFPVGLIVTLISALFLKRNAAPVTTA